MIIISHRGNTTGPNPQIENNPKYIQYALQMHFHVETDVWFKNNTFYLGHDEPKYPVAPEFFYNERIFAHCKNIEALYKLVTNPVVQAFYHNEDDVTLTSRGLLWSYPRENVLLTNKSIAVMPERVNNWQGLDKCFGICTDKAIEYKRLFIK